MFLNFSLITLFFRFLNLGILVAVCGYLYKRYLLPSIKEEMAEKKKKNTVLFHQISTLSNDVELLKRHIAQEKQAAETFKNTLPTWCDNVELLLVQKQKEKAIICTRLAQRNSIKQASIAKEYIQDKTALSTLEQLHTELRDYFAHPDHGLPYVERIITYINNEQLHG